MKTSKHTPSVIAATLCQRRNCSCSSRILKPEPATQWSHPRILGSELSTQWPHSVASFRTVEGCSAHRVPIPYRRRVFPVPNFPAVPQPKRVRVSALTYPMYKDSRMGALLFFCSLVSLISPADHQPLTNRSSTENDHYIIKTRRPLQSLRGAVS